MSDTNNAEKLLSRLQMIRPKVTDRLTRFDTAMAILKTEKRAFTDAENHESHTGEALKIIQELAQSVQQKAHAQIAVIVSRCLEAVFDEPYEFSIEFQQKRNRTEAVLAFQRDGAMIDPMTASGGGVVDVAAFALRVACLMLSRPAVRPLLVLDEPFRFVSEGYRARVRDLLHMLTDEFDMQIIMVTHIEDFKTGTVIELE